MLLVKNTKSKKTTKSKSPNTPANQTSFSRRVWLVYGLKNRFFKGSAAILLVLMALPVIFTFLYALPYTQPASTIMIGRALTGQTVKRKWVDIENIAPVLAHSVMMSEDGQFCFHNGVDWKELTDVIDNAMDGEKTRGASTLPMQMVKNLFLWPQRSFIRKIFEIPYAMITNLVLTKRRSMEIYLNIVEWDEGIFGAEAASQHYFKRPASKLTRKQAALLAVSLPSPVSRNPAKPSKSLKKLARTIEKRAQQAGAYIKCLEQ